MTSDHAAGHTLMRLQEIAGGLDEMRTEQRRHVFAEPSAIISFAIPAWTCVRTFLVPMPQTQMGHFQTKSEALSLPVY
jgi:hypothetical protein